MRLVVDSFQKPTAQHNRGIISNRRDFKIRKSQRTHLFARVVGFLVTVQHGLPAATDVIAGNKYSVSGTSIAIHVAFNVPAVPGIALRLEHGPNVSADPAFAFVWFCRTLGLYR